MTHIGPGQPQGLGVRIKIRQHTGVSGRSGGRAGAEGATITLLAMKWRAKGDRHNPYCTPALPKLEGGHGWPNSPNKLIPSRAPLAPQKLGERNWGRSQQHSLQRSPSSPNRRQHYGRQFSFLSTATALVLLDLAAAVPHLDRFSIPWASVALHIDHRGSLEFASRYKQAVTRPRRLVLPFANGLFCGYALFICHCVRITSRIYMCASHGQYEEVRELTRRPYRFVLASHLILPYELPSTESPYYTA